MNYRMIVRLCALCLLIESLFMVIPLSYALYAREDPMPFLITIGLLLVVGLPLALLSKPYRRTLYARDGWFCAGFIWILISLAGALPFFLCGMFPTYIDCFFETVSGFTTTGASILAQVENLPRGILMWRSLTNWVGGMGVLVFLLALLPVAEVDNRSLHLLRAESPGPTASKLVPKMAQTAKILYSIYFVLTLLTIVALVLAKMPLYDAVLHAWSIAGTGGFSCKNASIAFYQSPAINYVCATAMLLFSFNFMIFFHLIVRQFKSVLRDSEFLFHIGVVTASVCMITVNINSMFPSVGSSIEHAYFQVSTIITTTGFASTDFNLWPSFSKALLLLLMVLGGCAGSTAGGIKAIRSVILLKAAKREVSRLTHPRMVNPVKINGKALDDSKVNSVMVFFVFYVLIVILCTLLLSLDGFDFLSTFSATLATFNNIGPGLGIVGPIGNYSQFSLVSKVVMSFGMLLGRLEIFPILYLFAPSTIKQHGEEISSVSRRIWNRLLRKPVREARV